MISYPYQTVEVLLISQKECPIVINIIFSVYAAVLNDFTLL